MTATPLIFRPDGTFTIIQFTDLHWKDGNEKDHETRKLMEKIIDLEAPDLVMLTGDIIESGCESCISPKDAFLEAVAILEQKQVYWAAVFGNHDAEQGITREDLMDLQQQCKMSLSTAGPSDIHGVGNYCLEVLDADLVPSAALYCLDSGSYAPLPLSGYDWIHRDQIEWYISESERLTLQKGGTALPSLAFFHIPLPEFDEVWNYHKCFGHNYEGVGCPVINSGFFAAMIEQNDIMGAFVGHDHINDYQGELHGIRLCYGRASGYNTYGKESMILGARVIRLTQGSWSFETWLRLVDGSTIIQQPQHMAELKKYKL